MANVTLIRVDFRLIHGQVATKWVKVAQASKIVVVDDASSKDELLKSVLKMAAPQGVKCLVYSQERCVEKWKETQFGEGKVMMVFKDIPTCYAAWKDGLAVPKLQLGNVPNREGRKTLFGEVFVDENEMAMLKEMAAAGVEIEIHTIPDGPGSSFERAASKY